MFFIDEAHKRNYDTLLDVYKSSLPSVEYEVACYILALPEVLKRVPIDHDVEFPFDWVWIYDEAGERKNPSDALYYMDDPYKELVLAGFHMFNGEEFRLNKGLDRWGEVHFQVFIQACKIRGRFS